MKAIGYLHPSKIDQTDALIDIELAKPIALGHDLLIKVQAISVNPVDTKVRANKSPIAGEYKILGWDGVGEVVATGELVESFNIGDQVWYAGDITRAGTNAEFQLVDERIVGNKPQSLSNTQAAALPLTAITAWELLFDRLGLATILPNNDDAQAHIKQDEFTIKNKPQEHILIIGAAGGVGSILVQLAAKLTNAKVIGTASRPESKEWVESLGADFVINHHQPILAQLNALGINEVSHVISLTHTDQHFAQIVEVIAPQGKFALIDDPATPLDIMQLKMKAVSLHWESMFTRSMFTTWDMQKQQQLLNQLSMLVDQGVIKTTIGEHFGQINAANLRRAHAHIESHSMVGKIVLEGF
ncbi:MAG: zinc-binding alcohol dehydrogenase family protein [Oceanospirillaceae bacterium]